MRQAVKAAWWEFSVPLEGVVPHFYLDVRGLVTIGLGNLVDPQQASALPMRKADGTLATREDILADWALVRANPELARQGHLAAASVARLRLPLEDIKALVDRKLAQIDAHISARFVEYKTWCCDAQMGVPSMGWATGPAFRFPAFEAFVKAREFMLASEECKMVEAGNLGLRPRNLANRIMFRNAARVHSGAMDPAELYWPRDLVREAETDPDLHRVSPSEPPESPVVHTLDVDEDGTRIIHPAVFREPEE